MSHIDKHNIDEWLFNHFEGQLSFEEESQLMDFLESNPQYAEDLDLWANARIEEPEEEYPAMRSLLMEEPVEVIIGAGATTAGLAAWQRWGIGIAAVLGLGWMGYEIVEDNTNPNAAEVVQVAEEQSTGTLNTTFNTTLNSNGNEQPLLADANSMNGNSTNANPGLINRAHLNTNIHFNAGMNEFGMFPWQNAQTTNNGNVPVNAVVNNGNTNINNTNNGLNNGVDPNALANNGQNGNNGTNNNPITNVETNPEWSEVAIAEENLAVNGIEGLRTGDGFFADPEWARKVIIAPSDLDGDGIRSAHEHAPSYSDLDPTGVFPFRVPYKGVGFYNERNVALVVPENNPLTINPALAGNVGEGTNRFQTNYRYEWPGTDAQAHKATLSYDTYIKGIGGGIGAVASYDMADNGLHTSSHVGVMYARAFEFKMKHSKDGERTHTSKFTITPAIKVGYTQKKINQGDGDASVEPERGFVLNIADDPELNTSYGYQDVAAGIHLNANKMYAGAAVDHITSPIESMEDVDMSNQRVPRRYTAYVGTEFKKKRESTTSYRPALLFNQQGDISELWFSQELQLNKMVLGAGLASNGSLRGKVGANLGNANLAYQYDNTKSAYLDANKGSHELVFTLQLH